jgi:hypothetical protein
VLQAGASPDNFGEANTFDGVYPEPFDYAQGKLRRRAQCSALPRKGGYKRSNHYAYRIVKLEMVIVPLKVHYKSTLPSNNPKAVMEKRFTVVKTTRVVSLSDLKTLSFPLTELFYES